MPSPSFSARSRPQISLTGTGTKSSRSARKRSTTPLVLAPVDGAGGVDQPPADGDQRRVGDQQRQLPRRETPSTVGAGAAASAPRDCAAASPAPSRARRPARDLNCRAAFATSRGPRPDRRRLRRWSGPARRARRRSSSSFLPSVSSASTRPLPASAAPERQRLAARARAGVDARGRPAAARPARRPAGCPRPSPRTGRRGTPTGRTR